MLYLNDHLEDLDLGLALAQLSEQRREQALRFSHDAGRRTCAAAYLLLCEALRREYGIADKPLFSYGEHGKPALADHPDIHFNLSHCRLAAICAVSDRPVGVDVETVRSFSQSLLQYSMNDEEQARILGASRPDLEFTKLWTMKEAAVKLTGTGLTHDVKSILDNLDGAQLQTAVSTDGSYVYSVCQQPAPGTDTDGLLSDKPTPIFLKKNK